MHRLCISLVVALACLLALSEAQKDAFVRDQLIVYRIGDTDSKYYAVIRIRYIFPVLYV